MSLCVSIQSDFDRFGGASPTASAAGAWPGCGVLRDTIERPRSRRLIAKYSVVKQSTSYYSAAICTPMLSIGRSSGDPAVCSGGAQGRNLRDVSDASALALAAAPETQLRVIQSPVPNRARRRAALWSSAQ